MTTLTRYALHLGLPLDTDPDDAQRSMPRFARQVLGPTAEAFVDGDSFRVWGEPRDGTGTEHLHAVVYFDAFDEQEAHERGETAFSVLAAAGVVDGEANCWPTDEQRWPFAVSHADEWSRTVDA